MADFMADESNTLVDIVAGIALSDVQDAEPAAPPRNPQNQEGAEEEAKEDVVRVSMRDTLGLVFKEGEHEVEFYAAWVNYTQRGHLSDKAAYFWSLRDRADLIAGKKGYGIEEILEDWDDEGGR